MCVPAASATRRARSQPARRTFSASRWMRITALTKHSPARSATISASRPNRSAPQRASIISSFRSQSSWIQPPLDNLKAPRFETGKALLVAGIGERCTHENRRRHSQPMAALPPDRRQHPRPDRQGGLWRLLQRRRCRQFRLHRRRRSGRLLRPAARIPARADSRTEIRGVYPRASTSRPFAAPSTRSGITGCRHRA